MGWGDGKLLNKISSDLDAEAKRKADAARKKVEDDARIAEANAKAPAIELKFVEACGVSSKAYVRQAIVAAQAKTSKAGGYAGRSPEGQQRTGNLYDETRDASKPKDHPIVRYHQAENDAKLHARNGEIEKAIELYDRAGDLRVGEQKDYEKRQKAKGLAPDPKKVEGHREAIIETRKRSASLGKLNIDLKEIDPDVVAAKLVVTNFFRAEGGDYFF